MNSFRHNKLYCYFSVLIVLPFGIWFPDLLSSGKHLYLRMLNIKNEIKRVSNARTVSYLDGLTIEMLIIK